LGKCDVNKREFDLLDRDVQSTMGTQKKGILLRPRHRKGDIDQQGRGM
jgi:hypothetical protein